MKKKLLTLLGISVVLGGIVAFGSMNMNAVPVRAEEGGDTTEVVEDTTEEPVVESNDDPSVIQEVKNYFETVILPAVIASASTLIITAFGLVLKTLATKAKDKHITEKVDQGLENALALKDTVCTFIDATGNQIKEVICVTQEVIDENKKLRLLLGNVEPYVAKLPLLNQKVDGLLEQNAKLASIDKVAVSTGIAEQVNEIKDKLVK